MPSTYLQSGDLATYGVASATSDEILRASAIVDSYLGLPEGLVWSPDAQGLPCYMAALTPSFAGSLPAALIAGQPATIAWPQASFGAYGMIGTVLIVDRATSSLTEALVVTGVNTNAGTITVTAPVKSHAQGAPLEAGLVISEERAMDAKRSTTRTSRFPVARLIGAAGRYAYSRRSDQVAGLYNDYNLIAVLQTFGGPPMWQSIDVRQADLRPDTGEAWLPAGMLLAYYSDVRMSYVAGYPQASLPAAIKQATANIITNAASADYAPPNFKVAQAGGSKFERFSDSQLDTDTKNLLEPYRKKLFF